MIALLAFMALAQVRVDKLPDAPGVESRVTQIDMAASALATRTADLRRSLSDAGPNLLERGDLVAPGRLRVYSAPIRYKRGTEVYPIRLAWTPGATAVMECATNTVETAITKDGWKQVSGNGWVLGTRPVGAGDITVKRTDADTLEVAGLWPDGAITEYRLMRGGVKESIVLESAPDSTVWTYDTKLGDGTTLDVDGRFVRILADGSEVAVLPVATAHDAAGARVRGTYRLDGDVLEVSFPEKWFQGREYPITIDPTVQTIQGDADDTNAVGEDAFEGGDYAFWNSCYFLITLPDMAGYTISAATITLTAAQVGSGNTVASAYCDITGAWSYASTVSTMNALSFNAATATSIGSFSVNTPKSIDILGAVGTNGIAKIYGDDSSPAPCTVRLIRTSPTGTNDATSGGIPELGDENGGTSHLLFYDGTNATYFPFIELTYSGTGTTGARGSGSVGIIGL